MVDMAKTEFETTKYIWDALNLTDMLALGTNVQESNASAFRIEMRRMLVEIITWFGGTYHDWSACYINTRSHAPSAVEVRNFINNKAVTESGDHTGWIEPQIRAGNVNFPTAPFWPNIDKVCPCVRSYFDLS